MSRYCSRVMLAVFGLMALVPGTSNAADDQRVFRAGAYAVDISPIVLLIALQFVRYLVAYYGVKLL